MVKSLLCCTSSLFVFSCAACANPGQGNPGIKDGMLPSCPACPNCVSSQSVDVRHRIEPLRYTTSLHEAQDKLLTILRSMQRTTIIVREDDYIHATSASFLFRFVDDVEFYFYAEKKRFMCDQLHVSGTMILGSTGGALTV